MAQHPNSEPFDLFHTWYADAQGAEPNDPNAMALATVGADGQPSVRMVLLKDADARGFVFYTNYESRKGRQLLETRKAAIVMHWKSLGRQVREGLDFSISHRWQLAGAGVAAGLSGTRILTYDRTVSSTSPATDVLDTVGNPVSLRLRGSLDLDFGNWRYSFTSNYVDSYRNPVRSPNEVGSWITFNSSIGYEFNKANDSFLSGTMLRLSAVNIFDRDPPFVNQLQGFDSANATDTGRSISVEITKHW